MLHLYEIINKLPFVMIIGHGDGAGDIGVVVPLFAHELLTDQIPDRLGTVMIVLGFNMPIKRVNKPSLERYSKTIQRIHATKILSRTACGERLLAEKMYIL
jgi:hypothetical protein